MRIETVAKTARRKLLLDVDMSDLAARMHAGIGAAGAMHPQIRAGHRLHRRFQCALHRRQRVLHLPAEERRAVIFDGELVAGHRFQFCRHRPA
jgi:hypothetical protein